MISLTLGSNSKLVAFFQSILKFNNYYSDAIDGIFGQNTKKAVMDFQKYLGLSPTGVITDKFVSQILKYISVPTNIEYTSEIVDIIIQSLLYKYSFLKHTVIR